jgi:hypothetical protein
MQGDCPVTPNDAMLLSRFGIAVAVAIAVSAVVIWLDARSTRKRRECLFKMMREDNKRTNKRKGQP